MKNLSDTLMACLLYTSASKKLYICQSALSKAIKTFENELDIILIDRTSKSFKLTPEGQLLYENGTIALKVINEQLTKLQDSISLEKGNKMCIRDRSCV